MGGLLGLRDLGLGIYVTVWDLGLSGSTADRPFSWFPRVFWWRRGAWRMMSRKALQAQSWTVDSCWKYLQQGSCGEYALSPCREHESFHVKDGPARMLQAWRQLEIESWERRKMTPDSLHHRRFAMNPPGCGDMF